MIAEVQHLVHELARAEKGAMDSDKLYQVARAYIEAGLDLPYPLDEKMTLRQSEMVRHIAEDIDPDDDIYNAGR